MGKKKPHQKVSVVSKPVLGYILYEVQKYLSQYPDTCNKPTPRVIGLHPIIV